MTLRLSDPLDRAVIETEASMVGGHLRWLGLVLSDAAAAAQSALRAFGAVLHEPTGAALR